MKKTTLTLSLLLLAFISFGQEVINPINVSSNTTGEFGTVLSTTIDGTGLAEFPSLTAEHVATTPSDSYVTDAAAGFFDFEFDATYTISGFSFWNQNNGGPGEAGSTGINEVTISASTNGTDFTVIEGAPSSFAQVTTAASLPEMFSFDPVDATVIRLEFTSNYGDVSTGFAEIAFNGVELGLSKQELQNTIALYPNPTNSDIDIRNASKLALTNVTIFDVTGKQVMNIPIENNNALRPINVEKLMAGVYIVKIEGNNRSISKKLIKQ